MRVRLFLLHDTTDTPAAPSGRDCDWRKLMKRLSEAVELHGRWLGETACQVGIHNSTISRWLREHENARRRT